VIEAVVVPALFFERLEESHRAPPQCSVRVVVIW
jgi:hypothetical protein